MVNAVAAKISLLAGILVLVYASSFAVADEDVCIGSDQARIAAGFYPQYVKGTRDGSCILITRKSDTFLGCEEECEQRANGTLVSADTEESWLIVANLLLQIPFYSNETVLHEDNTEFWIGLYKNILEKWSWVNKKGTYPKNAEGWDVHHPDMKGICSGLQYASKRFHHFYSCFKVSDASARRTLQRIFGDIERVLLLKNL